MLLKNPKPPQLPSFSAQLYKTEVTWENGRLGTKSPSAANLGILNQRQRDGRKQRPENHKKNFEINTGQTVSGAGDGTGHHWKEPSSVLFAPSRQVLLYVGEMPPSLLWLWQKGPAGIPAARPPPSPHCSHSGWGDLSPWPASASSGCRIPFPQTRAGDLGLIKWTDFLKTAGLFQELMACQSSSTSKALAVFLEKMAITTLVTIQQFNCVPLVRGNTAIGHTHWPACLRVTPGEETATVNWDAA